MSTGTGDIESLQGMLRDAGYESVRRPVDKGRMSAEGVVRCEVIALREPYEILYMEAGQDWKRAASDVVKRHANPCLLVTSVGGPDVILTTIAYGVPEARPLHAPASRDSLAGFVKSIKAGPEDDMFSITGMVSEALRELPPHQPVVGEEHRTGGLQDALDAFKRSLMTAATQTREAIDTASWSSDAYVEGSRGNLDRLGVLLGRELQQEEITGLVLRHVLASGITAMRGDAGGSAAVSEVDYLLGRLADLAGVDAAGTGVEYGAVWQAADSIDDPLERQVFLDMAHDIVLGATGPEPARMGKRKFYGKEIRADRFMEELKSLGRGTLDDHDDQVTRIAGLVIGGAAVPQRPIDGTGQFDFVVDISNYELVDEQQVVMNDIGFRIETDRFHCKVMINDEVTATVLLKLREAVPEGEQGVVFTCRPVGGDVARMIREDRIVQIVDEQGIRKWCGITQAVPCRKGSVARVAYGDGMGSIVRIIQLDYASGFATAEVAPDGREARFLIRCMSEVDLEVPEDGDFEEAHREYFGFACRLADLSGDFFEDGMGAECTIHRTYRDLLGTRPDLHGMSGTSSDRLVGGDEEPVYVELENAHVVLNKHGNTPPTCTCYQRQNETYYHVLCRHMVAAINAYCLDGLGWPEKCKRIAMFTERLEAFQDGNVDRSIRAIHDALAPEHSPLLREYIRRFAGA